MYSQLLPVIAKHAVNEKERERAAALEKERRSLGPVGVQERFTRLGARAFSAAWDLRVRWLGDRVQPRTIVTRYPSQGR